MTARLAVAEVAEIGMTVLPRMDTRSWLSNELARRTGINQYRLAHAMKRLADAGLVEVEEMAGFAPLVSYRRKDLNNV